MGLPGSGKTTLAKKIVKLLKADWLNADKIRGKYNDWDFSKTGIIRQVKRMKILAKKSKKQKNYKGLALQDASNACFSPLWERTLNKTNGFSHFETNENPRGSHGLPDGGLSRFGCTYTLH